jgi:hypothetical protein
MTEPAAADNPNSPDRAITDAAWNAVAVASLAYHRELNALRVILRSATQHGLTRSDLVYASGLDAAFVGRLLDEVG